MSEPYLRSPGRCVVTEYTIFIIGKLFSPPISLDIYVARWRILRLPLELTTFRRLYASESFRSEQLRQFGRLGRDIAPLSEQTREFTSEEIAETLTEGPFGARRDQDGRKM